MNGRAIIVLVHSIRPWVSLCSSAYSELRRHIRAGPYVRCRACIQQKSERTRTSNGILVAEYPEEVLRAKQ